MTHGPLKVIDYAREPISDQEIEALLYETYVGGGYTDQEVASKIFAPSEVKKRGHILIALNEQNEPIGMIICATHLNPYKQTASSQEAEMQLLAVKPASRKSGAGELLCRAFEKKAAELGYSELVLSTQPSMSAAHKLYEKLGYKRNPARDWSRNGRSFLVYEKSLS